MNGERFERKALLLRPLYDEVGNTIEGGAGHWRVSIVARRQDVPRVARAGLESDEDVEHLSREVDVMCLRPLHALLRNRPDSVATCSSCLSMMRISVGESERSLGMKWAIDEGAHFISRIGNRLAMQNRKTVDLLHNVPDMDRSRWRTAFNDGTAMRSNVVRRNL